MPRAYDRKLAAEAGAVGGLIMKGSTIGLRQFANKVLPSYPFDSTAIVEAHPDTAEA